MGTPQPQLTTNQKVVTWARGKLGKKVGRGECWDLGEEALKSAGALTSRDLGPVGDDTDYVWGESIDIKNVEPGDILQLRDHLVTTTVETEIVFSDGSKIREKDERTAKRGHHTAIVRAKLAADGSVKTLEQHVKPLGDIVQRTRLHTRDVPTVETDTVEKHKHPASKKLESAKVKRKVTVSVTGTIWAYRPKPR